MRMIVIYRSTYRNEIKKGMAFKSVIVIEVHAEILVYG